MQFLTILSDDTEPISSVMSLNPTFIHNFLSLPKVSDICTVLSSINRLVIYFYMTTFQSFDLAFLVPLLLWALNQRGFTVGLVITCNYKIR